MEIEVRTEKLANSVKTSRQSKRSRWMVGVSLIEFAIGAPVVFLLVLGIFDLVKISYTKAIVEAGLIEGIKKFQEDPSVLNGLDVGGGATTLAQSQMNGIISASTNYIGDKLGTAYANGSLAQMAFLPPGYKSTVFTKAIRNSHCDPDNDGQGANITDDYLTPTPDTGLQSVAQQNLTRSARTQCMIESGLDSATTNLEDTIPRMALRYPTEITAEVKIPTMLFGQYTIPVRAAGFPLAIPTSYDCCSTELGSVGYATDFRGNKCCDTLTSCKNPALYSYSIMHVLPFSSTVTSEPQCCSSKTERFNDGRNTRSCCYLDSEVARGHNGDFDINGEKCCTLATSAAGDMWGNQCCTLWSDPVSHQYDPPNSNSGNRCCQSKSDGRGNACCYFDSERASMADGGTCCQAAFPAPGDYKGTQCCSSVTANDNKACCSTNRNTDSGSNTCCSALSSRAISYEKGVDKSNTALGNGSAYCCPQVSTVGCDGRCGSSATLDSCKVCSGDADLPGNLPTTKKDSYGTERDSCGNCFGSGPSCVYLTRYQFVTSNGSSQFERGAINNWGGWNESMYDGSLVSANVGSMNEGTYLDRYYDARGVPITAPVNFGTPGEIFEAEPSPPLENRPAAAGSCWKLCGAGRVWIRPVGAPTPTPIPTPTTPAGCYGRGGHAVVKENYLDAYSDSDVNDVAADNAAMQAYFNGTGGFPGLGSLNNRYPILTGTWGEMPPGCGQRFYTVRNMAGMLSFYVDGSCNVLAAEINGVFYKPKPVEKKDVYPGWGQSDTGVDGLCCGIQNWQVPAKACYYVYSSTALIPQWAFLLINIAGPLAINLPIPINMAGDWSHCLFPAEGNRDLEGIGNVIRTVNDLVTLLLLQPVGTRELYYDSECRPISNPFGNDDMKECGRADFAILPLIWILSPVSLQWDGVSGLENSLAYSQFPLSPHLKDKWYKWYASDKYPLLVFDPEHKGQINSAEQLFGNFTFGKYWIHGYAALASLDLNKDGKLQGDELKDLGLWFDSNQNGVSEPGEVKTAVEAGVTQIFVNFNRYDPKSSNLIADVGFLREENGKKIQGGSVDWFSMPYENKVSAGAFRDRQPREMKPGWELTTPEEYLRQLHPSDVTKEVSGLWKWESDSPVVSGQKFTGTLVFKDVDGVLEGRSIGEFNIPEGMGNKVKSVARSYWMTGQRKSSEGKEVVVEFDVLDTISHYNTHATAVLSPDGQSLKGESVVEAARDPKSGDILTMKYTWTAARFEVPQKLSDPLVLKK